MTKKTLQVDRVSYGISIRDTLRFLWRVVFLTAIILTIPAIYGFSRFRSLPAAISALRGDSLIVAEPLILVSDVHPGSTVTLRYLLTNATSRPIKLIGMNRSCSCTSTEDLPISLAASESRSIAATITTNTDENSLDGSIRLYTDHPRSSEIVLGYGIRFRHRTVKEDMAKHP
jgi:hypothetical protein